MSRLVLILLALSCRPPRSGEAQPRPTDTAEAGAPDSGEADGSDGDGSDGSDGSDGDLRPDPPTCGDGRIEWTDECEPTDDAACPDRCTAWCACPARPPGDALEVSFLDVGQGDAALVITPDGLVGLFDAGDRGAAGGLLAALDDRGVDDLDFVVSSHFHADHIGGMDEVIRAYPGITAAWDSGLPYDSDTFRSYAAAAGPRRQAVAAGALLDLGPRVRADVLHAAGPDDNPNNDSVVVRLEFDGVGVLIGGDCEGPCEAAFDPGPTAIYKVHHHGADDSSTAALLDQLQPEVAVFPVGAGNAYGHPHPAVVDRLEARGVAIWRTDRDGHVDVSISGGAWGVEAGWR